MQYTTAEVLHADLTTQRCDLSSGYSYEHAEICTGSNVLHCADNLLDQYMRTVNLDISCTLAKKADGKCLLGDTCPYLHDGMTDCKSNATPEPD